jgi:hypothetical protein
VIDLGTLGRQSQTLIEADAAMADPGRGHARDIGRVVHGLIMLPHVLGVSAAAQQKGEVLVIWPDDALGEFALVLGARLPARGADAGDPGIGFGKNVWM